MDGAYHNTNINWHFNKALDISEQSKPLISYTWDGAHIIELAGKKSRGQFGRDQVITVPWIKETFDEIAASKSSYGRGKNWVAINDVSVLDRTAQSVEGEAANAEDVEHVQQGKVRKFQSFSNTRFTTYSHRALSVFRNNFRPNVLAMEAMNDPGVRRMREAPLILRTSGLEDFYDEVGKASTRLQSTRLYSWSTNEIMDECVATLNGMANDLDSENFSPSLQSFYGTVDEVRSKQRYSGIKLTPKNDGTTTEEAFNADIAMVRNELAENIRVFSNDLSSRVEKATPSISKLSRESFSYAAIRHRGSTVPEEFHTLASMHQAAGYLDESCTREQLDGEYRKFLDTVSHDADAQGLTKRQRKLKMTTEEAIYSTMFVSPTKTESFRNVAHLLSRTAAQSSCEAVTEVKYFYLNPYSLLLIQKDLSKNCSL